MEYVSKTYKLDEEVIEAVEKLPMSLNQFLRKVLTADGVFGERPKRVSKRQCEAERLRASDPMAAGRDDIAHGMHEELPSGGSVAVVGAARAIERVESPRSHSFHSGTRPIAGCVACAEMAKGLK